MCTLYPPKAVSMYAIKGFFKVYTIYTQFSALCASFDDVDESEHVICTSSLPLCALFDDADESEHVICTSSSFSGSSLFLS